MVCLYCIVLPRNKMTPDACFCVVVVVVVVVCVFSIFKTFLFLKKMHPFYISYVIVGCWLFGSSGLLHDCYVLFCSAFLSPTLKMTQDRNEIEWRKPVLVRSMTYGRCKKPSRRSIYLRPTQTRRCILCGPCPSQKRIMLVLCVCVCVCVCVW